MMHFRLVFCWLPLVTLLVGCGEQAPPKPELPPFTPIADADKDKPKDKDDAKPKDKGLEPAKAGPAPVWQNVVLRPTFGFPKTKDKTFKNGTGFAIRDNEGRPFMVTCVHLLPAVGWKALNRLDVHSLSGKPLGKCTLKPVYIGRSMFMNDEPGYPADCREDIAIFPLQSGAKVRPLPLAKQEPKYDDPVWFVGREFKRGDGDETPYAAKVHLVQDGNFQIGMADKKLVVPGFSGSPIVSQRGEVIGILIGGLAKSDIICGVTVREVRRRLRENGVAVD